MVEQVFGGDWTRQKLERLRGYLIEYRRIFTVNPRAQFFTTWYVDAFAGTGSHATNSAAERTENVGEDENVGEEIDSDQDAAHFLEGSARIALGINSPFDRYLFIEQSKGKASVLRETIQRDFPHLMERVEVRTGEANVEIQSWCRERDWSKDRAVVFLDPFGMQVEWDTVASLARTKGVDLWYLFPVITRLLRRDRNLDESWSKRLDSLFGTEQWRSHFYPIKPTRDLFGDYEKVERDATTANVVDFIKQRLEAEFVAVAKSRIMRNSKGAPLYALSFAASNDKGAKPAIRIAQHLLDT